MPARTDKSLIRIFEQTADGIYCLSADHRITYANQRLADWLGCTVDALINAACEFSAWPNRDELKNKWSGLAVPPDAAGDRAVTSVVFAPAQNEKLRRANATFFPLRRPDDNQPAWLVFVSLNPQTAFGSDDGSLPLASPTDGNASNSALSTIPLSPAQVRQILSEQIVLAARHGLPIGPDQFVGISPDAQRIRRAAGWVASSGADALIWGPVDSGKEFLARLIVASGPTKPAPTPVLIDCPTLDAETLQRILTGTCRQLPPDQRVVLLRDVDCLSGECAAELRGFLQLPHHGLRILATSQRPLTGRPEDDEYDAALAARLSGLVIEIPPLCKRPEDIPLLAQALLESFLRAVPSPPSPARSFAPATLKMLAEYHWPGEVGELKSVVHLAAQHAVQSQILVADLPDRFRLAYQAARTPRYQPTELVLDDYLANIERQLIERALRQAKWNKAQAARALSMSRARLIRRAEQLGIRFPAHEFPFVEADDAPE